MALAANGPRLLSLKSSLEAHRLLVIYIYTSSQNVSRSTSTLCADVFY